VTTQQEAREALAVVGMSTSVRHIPFTSAMKTLAAFIDQPPASMVSADENVEPHRDVTYPLGFQLDRAMTAALCGETLPAEAAPAAVPVPDEAAIDTLGRSLYDRYGPVEFARWDDTTPEVRLHWHMEAKVHLSLIGYAELRAEVRAYKDAVAGHSERWEAAEAERDALANKCSDAESEIRALRREVERLGNELARWEGESCGGDCLAAPCTYCDGTRRTTGRGKELEQQVADANERAEAAEAKLAASERYAERLREAARNVIAWDWSDNDEEPLADIAHLALVLKQADAARATTTQLSTSAEPNGSSAQQQGGE
jgi:hypothetical protein